MLKYIIKKTKSKSMPDNSMPPYFVTLLTSFPMIILILYYSICTKGLFEIIEAIIFVVAIYICELFSNTLLLSLVDRLEKHKLQNTADIYDDHIEHTDLWFKNSVNFVDVKKSLCSILCNQSATNKW